MINKCVPGILTAILCTEITGLCPEPSSGINRREAITLFKIGCLYFITYSKSQGGIAIPHLNPYTGVLGYGGAYARINAE